MIQSESTFTVYSPPFTSSTTSLFCRLIILSSSITVFVHFFILWQGEGTNKSRKLLDKQYSCGDTPIIFPAIISFIVLGLSFAYYKRRGGGVASIKQNMCTVEVTSQGIKITEQQHVGFVDCRKQNFIEGTTRNDEKITNKYHQFLRKEQFIPIERVIDCIVTEVVYTYKVINCLMFRVLKKDVKQHKTLHVKESGGVNMKKGRRDGQCNDGKNYEHDTGDTKSCHDRDDTLPLISKLMLEDDNVELIPAFSPHLVTLTYVECENMWLQLFSCINSSKKEDGQTRSN